METLTKNSLVSLINLGNKFIKFTETLSGRERVNAILTN